MRFIRIKRGILACMSEHVFTMKGRQAVRLCIFITLLIVMYIFIFALSAQDGVASGGLSEKIAALIVPQTAESFDIWHHLVRKSAHVLEFAALFLLWYGVAGEAFPYQTPFSQVGLPALITLLSAAADEIHQLYVPGRSAQVGDVLIDMIGVVVLSCLILLLRRDG